MVVPWEPIKPPPGVPEFADYTLIPPPPVRTTPTSFTAGIFQPFVWRPTLVPNGTGPASFTLFPFAFTPTNRGPPTAIFPELIRQAVSIIPQTINSVSFALVPHVRTPTSFTTAITVSSPLPWGKILVPQSSTGIVWSPIYAVLIPFHHSGVQRIEWAIKRKIEWIVAKQIVEQVYDRDLQWMHNLDFESMYPAQRAAMIDTIAQSIEMHYLVSKGMLLTDCYAMIDEIKKERQQRDDEEAIIHLLDDE